MSKRYADRAKQWSISLYVGSIEDYKSLIELVLRRESGIGPLKRPSVWKLHGVDFKEGPIRPNSCALTRSATGGERAEQRSGIIGAGELREIDQKCGATLPNAARALFFTRAWRSRGPHTQPNRLRYFRPGACKFRILSNNT